MGGDLVEQRREENQGFLSLELRIGGHVHVHAGPERMQLTWD